VNLSRLERFVERELYFREAADQMVSGSVTKEEVIDEVIANALGDGGEKPQKLALEPWLYRLDPCHRRSPGPRLRPRLPVSLEDSARVPNVRASDEPELQFHQPDETLTRESVIADSRMATPERQRIRGRNEPFDESALSGCKTARPRGFYLHTIKRFISSAYALSSGVAIRLSAITLSRVRVSSG